MGEPIGMKLDAPTLVALSDERPLAFADAIKANMTATTQLVLCVLPTSKKDRYDQIKRTCLLDLPIPSQCIVAK